MKWYILLLLSLTFCSVVLASSEVLFPGFGGSEVYSYFFGGNEVGMFLGADALPPTILILYPTEGLTLNINSSIPLNFSITDPSPLNNCFYSVYNESNSVIINNQSTTCTSNTTFNLPRSGYYTIFLYGNDTFNNYNHSVRNFRVSLERPAVNQIRPADRSYNQGNRTNLSFTATDFDGIDYCDLYSNFTGSWTLNETFNFVTSGLEVSTIKNTSEGLYIWNVNCTDNTELSDFATNNYTFVTDKTKPFINFTTGNNSVLVGSNINISYNISDNFNLSSNCFFTLRNDDGDLHNYGENTTFECNATSRFFSILVTPDNYSLQFWAYDQAANLNHSTMYFTVNPTPSEGGGGAGGQFGGTETINVLTFNQNNLSKGYSDLERARAYASFFLMCESKYGDKTCNLKNVEFLAVCQEIGGIPINREDCLPLYKLYLADETRNILVTRQIADQYGLVKLIKGERVFLELLPQVIDSFWLGKDGIFKINVLASKSIKACNPQSTGRSYQFSCNLTSNTTAEITLKDTEKVFVKKYDGIVSWTQDITGVTTYQNISVRLINIWFLIPGINLYVWQFSMGVIFLLLLGLYFSILRRFRFNPKALKQVVKVKKK